MSDNPRETLMLNLVHLGASDQRFAASLLGTRAPSPKQMHWIGVLADRCIAPKEVTLTAEPIANVSGIVDLLSRGRSTLKWPKVAFRVDGTDLRLSIAGDASKHPGTINVTDSRGGTWYGRIHLDGRWEASKSATQAQSRNIVAALQSFAADPAGVAAQYGHLTGNCCFCSHDLTDERSTDVGYGPVCAKRYSLPWGE